MDTHVKTAYADWIEDQISGKKMLAFTLNFGRRHEGEWLTENVALATVRRFKRGLCRVAYGPRALCRNNPAELIFVAVHEGKITRERAATQFHVHGVIEVPKGRTIGTWESVCEEAWVSLAWADQKSHDFRKCRDAGWVKYLLKTRTKEDLEESIDLSTLNLQSFRDS